jgi:hypothetical protein
VEQIASFTQGERSAGIQVFNAVLFLRVGGAGKDFLKKLLTFFGWVGRISEICQKADESFLKEMVFIGV